MITNYFGCIAGIEQGYIHIAKQTMHTWLETIPEERAAHADEDLRWKSFKITPELSGTLPLPFSRGQYVKVTVEEKQAKAVSLLTGPMIAVRKIGPRICHDFLHVKQTKTSVVKQTKTSVNRDTLTDNILRITHRKKRKSIRYTDIRQQEQKFLDMTALTVDEFDQLVPAFEEAFQERMKEWCIGGNKRIGRGYLPQRNCAFPTPEDRLLFILVYLRSTSLRDSLRQTREDPWIPTLSLALRTALKSLADAGKLHNVRIRELCNRIFGSS